jgi:hypothetical protein
MTTIRSVASWSVTLRNSKTDNFIRTVNILPVDECGCNGGKPWRAKFLWLDNSNFPYFFDEITTTIHLPKWFLVSFRGFSLTISEQSAGVPFWNLCQLQNHWNPVQYSSLWMPGNTECQCWIQKERYTRFPFRVLNFPSPSPPFLDSKTPVTLHYKLCGKPSTFSCNGLHSINPGSEFANRTSLMIPSFSSSQQSVSFQPPVGCPERAMYFSRYGIAK